MDRRTRWALLATGLLAMAMMTSACELSFPVVDCSGIDQPDMGGLVCFGLNVAAVGVGLIAIVLAILAALGGATPV